MSVECPKLFTEKSQAAMFFTFSFVFGSFLVVVLCTHTACVSLQIPQA